MVFGFFLLDLFMVIELEFKFLNGEEYEEDGSLVLIQVPEGTAAEDDAMGVSLF